MRNNKTTSRTIRLWGYILLVIAAVNVATDLAYRHAAGLSFYTPFSMGVVIAEISIALTGIVSISIANVLRNVEERLTKIETR